MGSVRKHQWMHLRHINSLIDSYICVIWGDMSSVTWGDPGTARARQTISRSSSCTRCSDEGAALRAAPGHWRFEWPMENACFRAEGYAVRWICCGFAWSFILDLLLVAFLALHCFCVISPSILAFLVFSMCVLLFLAVQSLLPCGCSCFSCLSCLLFCARLSFSVCCSLLPCDFSCTSGFSCFFCLSCSSLAFLLFSLLYCFLSSCGVYFPYLNRSCFLWPVLPSLFISCALSLCCLLRAFVCLF